ncbi:hypothetical protein ADIMK_2134 [Marinobacterium lacunae]|uniref:Uncharacterized protein n=1 Tax=Marinobacterium lacunae TaxID=1232683 RepID=A0A081FYS3_9GAMM|nr:hypothetical protein [Marinobacterium lacunae]KEA63678.1 hypothetical protein ADIMK_2134 [Marinobacterium lacunae]MBR9883817.1 hypothetical protein [Oceanospirillales bacterium]
MKDDDITAYLQQFSLEQLDEIRQLVDKKADEKKRQLEEKLRKQQQPMRRTGGMPPSPPKDIAALAEAADLDISGLMRDIDRRKR